MKLGGWSRLWIVLSFAWAIPVAFLGFDDAPSIAKIRQEWSDQGLKAVAFKVSVDENYALSSEEVEADIRETYTTPDSVIEWLERIEKSPNPNNNQPKLTSTVAPINEYYRSQLKDFPSMRANYFGTLLAVWAIPPAILLLLGLCTRWIWNGFKSPKEPI